MTEEEVTRLELLKRRVREVQNRGLDKFNASLTGRAMPDAGVLEYQSMVPVAIGFYKRLEDAIAAGEDASYTYFMLADEARTLRPMHVYQGLLTQMTLRVLETL